MDIRKVTTRMKTKRAGILIILGLFVTTLFAPMAAFASSEGRRNTAIAVTAATLYSLIKGKDTQGLALGAGSYYAWKRYNDARQQEAKKQSYKYGYRRDSKNNYKRDYKAGKYSKKYSPKHSGKHSNYRSYSKR